MAEDAPKQKWTRSQRFQLSSLGREAGTAWQADIVASRELAGRQSFEAAQQAWAQQRALEPLDGLYLRELVDGPRTIDELATSLDGCGPNKAEVRKAVTRLVERALLEPVVPPPAPSRW